MRVTNETLRAVFLNALETAQRRMADTQNQVSTGKRINVPSDDPLAAARAGQIDASLSRLTQYQANGVIAKHQLGLEEETLASVIDNLQRVRELVVQANNATLDDASRSAIAAELKQRLDGVLALANTSDANGRYLFAGLSETTMPFSTTATGVVYNGDQRQRSLQVSDERLVAVNDSGAAALSADSERQRKVRARRGCREHRHGRARGRHRRPDGLRARHLHDHVFDTGRLRSARQRRRARRERHVLAGPVDRVRGDRHPAQRRARRRGYVHRDPERIVRSSRPRWSISTLEAPAADLAKRATAAKSSRQLLST